MCLGACGSGLQCSSPRAAPSPSQCMLRLAWPTADRRGAADVGVVDEPGTCCCPGGVATGMLARARRVVLVALLVYLPVTLTIVAEYADLPRVKVCSFDSVPEWWPDWLTGIVA